MSEAVGARMLDEKQAAKYLGVSPQFLRKARCVGHIPGKCEAPPFVRVGPRRIGYDLVDLDAWINSRKVRPSELAD